MLCLVLVTLLCSSVSKNWRKIMLPFKPASDRLLAASALVKKINVLEATFPLAFHNSHHLPLWKSFSSICAAHTGRIMS